MKTARIAGWMVVGALVGSMLTGGHALASSDDLSRIRQELAGIRKALEAQVRLCR